MSSRQPRYFESPILTVKECANFLRCHSSTIYRLVRNHQLPAFKLGSDWRFNKAEIVAWIEKQGAGERARH